MDGAGRSISSEPGGGDRSPAPVVFVSVLAFVGLGLPEGALGITYPEIRETFGLPLSGLGLVLYPYTGGYLTATIAHGRIAGRIAIARVLVGAAVCACIGAAAFAVGPAFAVLMIGSYLLGLSAGGIDAALNSYVSVHLPHRVLGFMHGGFGLGATLGPLAVVFILNAGWSWRVAYGALAVWQVGLGLTWFAIRRQLVTTRSDARNGRDAHDAQVVGFEGDVAETDLGEPVAEVVAPATTSATGSVGAARRGVAPMNILMFFLYTGAEGSAGFLVATLLIDRGVASDTAASLTTAYWLALTVGRFGVGVIGPRLSPSHALLVGSVGIVAGGSLVAFGGTTLAAPGLLLLGLSLAPFFPSLVALTPSRVGAARAPNAIGLQLAAASIGVATVPSVIARIADAMGPSVIGPCLLVAAGALALGHVVTGTLAGDLGSRPRT